MSTVVEFSIEDKIVRSKYSLEEWKKIPYISTIYNGFWKPEPVCLGVLTPEDPDILLEMTLESYFKYIETLRYLCSEVSLWNENYQNLITDKAEDFSFNRVILDTEWNDVVSELNSQLYGHLFVPRIFETIIDTAISYRDIEDISVFDKQPNIVYHAEKLVASFEDCYQKPIVNTALIDAITPSKICWRTEKQIIDKLSALTGGIINNQFLNRFPQIVLSGGLISALWSMAEVDDYIRNYSPDIDMYIVMDERVVEDDSEVAYTIRPNLVKNIIDYMVNFGVKIYNNRSVIVFGSEVSKIPIQLICSDYTNEWDLYSSFDMVHLQVGLNSANGLTATPMSYLSHKTRQTQYNSLFGMKPYRILKALRRGFSVIRDKTVEFVFEKIFANDIELFVNYADESNPIKEYTGIDSLGDYLGDKYTEVSYDQIINDIFNLNINLNANFHNPIFTNEYETGEYYLRTNWNYEPAIRNGLYIPDKNHYFRLNGCILNVDQMKNPNEQFIDITIPENYYMKQMMEQYVEKITSEMKVPNISAINNNRIRIRTDWIDKFDRHWINLYVHKFVVMDGVGYLHWGIV